MEIEHISIIKDVVLMLSAATGAIIAVLGYFRWKKELLFKENRELSKKILILINNINSTVLSRRANFYIFLYRKDENGMSCVDNKSDESVIHLASITSKDLDKLRDILHEVKSIWGESLCKVINDYIRSINLLLYKMKIDANPNHKGVYEVYKDERMLLPVSLGLPDDYVFEDVVFELNDVAYKLLKYELEGYLTPNRK